MPFVLTKRELTRHQQNNRGKKTEIPLVLHDLPNGREGRLIHYSNERHSGSNAPVLGLTYAALFSTLCFASLCFIFMSQQQSEL